MRIIIKTGGVVLIGLTLTGLIFAAVGGLPGKAKSVAAPNVVPAAVNLLSNGDFERPGITSQPDMSPPIGRIHGTNGVNWQDNSAWADIAVDYALDTTDAHGGKTCQKIIVSDKKTGQAQFLQNLKMPAGKKLHVSAWVRSASSLPVRLELRKAPEVTATYGQASATIGTGWQRIDLTGTPTQSEDTMLLIISENPGTFWLDDVSVTEVP